MKQSHISSSVNVAALKSQLAKYLRMVRSGCEVIVTDHRQPVARLVPYEPLGTLETIRPKEAFSEVATLEVTSVKRVPAINSLSLLSQERGKR